MNKHELLTHIQQSFGEGALALANGLVSAFAQGQLLDKKMRKIRSIEDTTVEMDSRARVARALKLLFEKNDLLDYNRAAYIVRFKNISGSFENFDVKDQDPESLASLIYTLMEIYHDETFEVKREIYVPRELYDMSLQFAIQGVAFVKN